MSDILIYLTPILLVLVAIILVLGLLNMARGGSPSLSQKLMRYRILMQFLAVTAMMGALYFFGN